MKDKDKDSAEAAQLKHILIISKKAGFRRCGIAHADRPVTYKADLFTAEELAALRAEPMLIVSEVSEPVGAFVEERPTGLQVPKGIHFPKKAG